MKVFIVLKNEWIELGECESEKVTAVDSVYASKEAADIRATVLSLEHATWGEVIEKEIQ